MELRGTELNRKKIYSVDQDDLIVGSPFSP